MDFDVIVVGGGHAGIEASMAAAHLGMQTLLLTLNAKMIGNTPCNPHIGGSAKGVVVREIDALGGMMGLFADHHPLQIKMLNTGKGPGVQCLRAQVDKKGYPAYVQEVLFRTEKLTVMEGEAIDLIHDGKSVQGVILKDGTHIGASAVILTTGTYMNSSVIRGTSVLRSGPDGEKASIGLSDSLRKMGISLMRLKTGTPPRIDEKTIDFSKASIQPGMGGELAFSYMTDVFTPLEKQLPCYLIYTTAETKRLIEEHLSESAVYNGTIKGIGPRYCPSIESKVERFRDKERHQLFLEPEYESGASIYLQGFSTGFGEEMQERLVHTLPGLEKAKILKYAYQIEYDSLSPFQFDETLKVKAYSGLYVAGQICGTSGYEEAAGLGLIAGINAVMSIKGEPPFVLRRDEAYIGVMIDDLVTKGADEPYRLLSSRAEYRLLLRHDNADMRLTEKGRAIGLVDDKRYARYAEKAAKISKARLLLEQESVNRVDVDGLLRQHGYLDTNESHKGINLLKRPYIHYADIAPYIAGLADLDLNENDILTLETSIKYEGYIAQAQKDAAHERKMENIALPCDIDYHHLDGLRLEARQKLADIRPKTIGQASRIPGVNPADVSILILTLKKRGMI